MSKYTITYGYQSSNQLESVRRFSKKENAKKWG